MASTQATQNERIVHSSAQPRTFKDERASGAQARKETETSAKIGASGASIEAIAGVAAMVLAILGLVNVGSPTMMAAIATLCIGGGLLVEGAAIASRFNKLHQQLGGRRGDIALGGGTSAEVLGGVAGIALGVLALILGDITITLLAAAAIVFGGSLLLGSSSTSRMAHFGTPAVEEHPRAQEVAREATQASAGVQMLVGIGAITLGILALAGVGGAGTPMVLILVAMLSVGVALLLSGAAISSRMMGALGS